MKEKNLAVTQAAFELHNYYAFGQDDWFIAVGAGADCLYVYCRYEPENIMFPESYKGFPVIPKLIGDTIINC